MTDEMPVSPLAGIKLDGMADVFKTNAASLSVVPNYSSCYLDMRSTWHQLVVIGNGFDLACDLNSSFSSFFEPRFEKMRDIEAADMPDGGNVVSRLREAGLTVWDIILFDRSGDDWCDVEGAIAKWMRPSNPARFIDLLDSIFELVFSGKKWQRSLLRRDSVERHVVRYIVEGGFGLEGDYSRDKLNVLLLEELHRLENAFDVYLRKQVEMTPRYPECARELLRDIIMRDMPNEEDYQTELSVLSFNYTGPKEMQLCDVDDTVSYVNIHGRLDEGIIIGIDGKGLMTNANVLPFTKTYRLMAKGGPRYNDVLPGDVSLIKFFGHSLSSADYSYFQAIFDAVDLYGGDTCLAFYYRRYANKSDLEVRTDMMKRVTDLLSIYGETLDNIDHGNNLIHKLLLEGRLSIESI